MSRRIPTMVAFSILSTFIALGCAWMLAGPAPHGDDMIKAKNHTGGKFHNTEPTTVFRSGGFWSTACGFLFNGHKHRVPRQPLPVVPMNGYGRTPAGPGLRFAWLGHAGVLLEIDGKRVLIDPVFSRRASFLSWAGPKRFQPAPIQVADLPAIDAVLISHDHYDHLDKAVICALAAKTSGFHVPLGVGAILESWGIPKAGIHEYAWWEGRTADGVTYTAVPARHFSGRGLFDRFQTLWCGWVVAGNRRRIYHSGDTGITPQFREIGDAFGPFDLAFIKMAAYNENWPDIHLNPEQAVEAFGDLQGRLLVPIHWAVFDLSLHAWYEPIERLVQAAEKARAPLLTPLMGELVDPASHHNRFWWRPLIPGGADQAGK